MVCELYSVKLLPKKKKEVFCKIINCIECWFKAWILEPVDLSLNSVSATYQLILDKLFNLRVPWK